MKEIFVENMSNLQEKLGKSWKICENLSLYCNFSHVFFRILILSAGTPLLLSYWRLQKHNTIVIRQRNETPSKVENYRKLLIFLSKSPENLLLSPEICITTCIYADILFLDNPIPCSNSSAMDYPRFWPTIMFAAKT